MPVAASSILERVRTQLIDTGDVYRWSDAELLKWLSDGQRTVVAMAPGASSDAAVISLSAGTHQNIPADGHMLLSVVRNVAADGVTPGRAVRIVSREILDAYTPDWHSSARTAAVQNYIFDPQRPKEFYVYPPNNGTGKLEIVYSILPGEMTTLSDTLVVQDIYQTALVDYVLFRAHQKDGDWSAGMAVATNYLQMFLSYMGQGETSQLQNNPNLQLASPDLTTKGGAK